MKFEHETKKKALCDILKTNEKKLFLKIGFKVNAPVLHSVPIVDILPHIIGFKSDVKIHTIRGVTAL